MDYLFVEKDNKNIYSPEDKHYKNIEIEGKNDFNLLNYILFRLTKNTSDKKYTCFCK